MMSLGHRGGGAAQGRADEEQADGHQEEILAAHQVAELAVDGHPHGDGQRVGGQDPGHVRGAAEVAHDGGQGGATIVWSMADRNMTTSREA